MASNDIPFVELAKSATFWLPDETDAHLNGGQAETYRKEGEEIAVNMRTGTKMRMFPDELVRPTVVPPRRPTVGIRGSREPGSI